MIPSEPAKESTVPIKQLQPNLWRGTLDICRGELRQVWKDFGAHVIICHLTDGHAETIEPLLADGIRCAAGNFPGMRISFVICDSSYTAESLDDSVLEATEFAAKQALRGLYAAARPNVQVVAVPHDGYDGNCRSGRGSALWMIYEEMEQSRASLLLVLSGGLQNEMGWWQEAFSRVVQQHPYDHPGRPYIIFPRYTRHLLDDALARLTLGPLTTLLGRHMPACNTPELALPECSVVFEREVPWTEARLGEASVVYTAFDAAADPVTLVYELSLGTRLHAVADEALLAPSEQQLIAAALERLLHYETASSMVSKNLEPDVSLLEPRRWGPERSGACWSDPGPSDAFDVDRKLALLLDRWDEYAGAVTEVQGPQTAAWLQQQRDDMAALVQSADGPLRFLGVDRGRWITMLQRAVAHLLLRRDVETPARCLAYLHVAAQLELVRECLEQLGLAKVGQVRRAQSALGPPAATARAFYEDFLEPRVEALAREFFHRRGRIRERMGVGLF